MKLIFTSVDLIAVTELRDMLKAAGIACYINNEISSTLAGGIPQVECMPELWIEDNAREAEAIQIKKDWLAPRIQGTAWTCPHCGEKLEPQFTSCWKCGTKKK
jgi:predicted RNA-binding Zn-ribbon protein involved in translation (DUF1610 family)